MNNVNIIQLHTDGSYVCWQYQAGRLTEVTANAAGRWWVLVPGADVLMLQAKLPQLSAKALHEGLPYAFEEHLLEDVNDLHFSVVDRQDDALVTVAVVAKRTMQQWLAQLQALGIKPEKMLPDYMMVPFVAGQIQVGLDRKMAYVRSAQWQGFAVPSDNLPTLLKSQVADASDLGVTILLKNHWR